MSNYAEESELENSSIKRTTAFSPMPLPLSPRKGYVFGPVYLSKVSISFPWHSFCEKNAMQIIAEPRVSRYCVVISLERKADVGILTIHAPLLHPMFPILPQIDEQLAILALQGLFEGSLLNGDGGLVKKGFMHDQFRLEGLEIVVDFPRRMFKIHDLDGFVDSQWEWFSSDHRTTPMGNLLGERPIIRIHRIAHTQNCLSKIWRLEIRLYGTDIRQFRVEFLNERCQFIFRSARVQLLKLLVPALHGKVWFCPDILTMHGETREICRILHACNDAERSDTLIGPIVEFAA